MKPRRFAFAAALFLAFAATLAASPPDTGWEPVDAVLGAGKDLPGNVRRYGWPRSDLHVTIGGVPVEPGLALGSWAGFLRIPAGTDAITMGDLVVLESELEPVLSQLEAGGFEILAIHNHLAGENPHVLYVHFHGHGDPAALAKTIKATLDRTKTPPSGTPAKASLEQEKIFATLQEALGRKGMMSGTVLQVGVARAEPILEGSLEIPPGIGMSNSMNFQTVGSRVATTGDFVLIADEVNPVLRELTSHGFQVTALHSHMLRETPRLFFMHFWAVDSPEKIGAGMKAALSRIAIK